MNTAFQAVNRPGKLVNREQTLNEIHNAIAQDGRECRIVLLCGNGGLGKTRLLQEVAMKFGHQDYLDPLGLEPSGKWQHQDVACSTIIDFIETKLHVRDELRNCISDYKFNWKIYNESSEESPLDLISHKNAKTKLGRIPYIGTTYSTTKESIQDVDNQFWNEYKQASDRYRMVLLLDTVEELANLSTEWLERHDILNDDDRQGTAVQWLLDAIEQGKFINTTLIFAGRPVEGKPFFNKLIELVNEINSPNCTIKLIETERFTYIDTKKYVQFLHEDWESAYAGNHDSGTVETIISSLSYLLENETYLRALHIYTGGLPIRLALYLDVVVDAKRLPEPLKDDFEDVCARLNLSEEEGQKILEGKSFSDEESDVLRMARKQIERDFVLRLFRPDSGLAGRILLHLVRATRGLSAEQLYFIENCQTRVLGTEKTIVELQELFDEAEQWISAKDREYGATEISFADIKGILNPMSKYAILKLHKNERYILQDEVYRIYADAINTDSAIEKERIARRKLYWKIIASNEPLRMALIRSLRATNTSLLARIVIEREERILNTSLPQQRPSEEQEQSEWMVQLEELDTARLHYYLLLGPFQHFFETYFGYFFRKSILSMSQSDEVDIFKAELARTLNNKYLKKFVVIDETDLEDFDNEFGTLWRMLEQHEAARSILRLTMRGKPQDAQERAQQIEAAIEIDAELSSREKASWQSKRAKSERWCWLAYSLALQGKYEEAHELIDVAEKELTILLENTNDHGGFRDTYVEAHLGFLLAELYNTQGYSFVQLGQYRKAVDSYTQAAKQLRDMSQGQLFHAELAVMLNNKSRALVEMGLKRSVRICEDALNLRLRDNTPLIAIGYSYNTLGLIYNKVYRSRDALEVCATAYAIARHVGDERLLGLVHKELATALRRSARDKLTRDPGSVERMFVQAETALDRALEQIGPGPESIRRAELDIEQGSLYRDWFEFTSPTDESFRNRYFRNAEDYLKQAVGFGFKNEVAHIYLDALTNLSWLYYYASDFAKLEQSIQDFDQKIATSYSDCLFKLNNKPPEPPDGSDEWPHFVFYQLGKMESLKGRLAFRKIRTSRESAQSEGGLSEELNGRFRIAAKAFAFASSYTELFAPNSFALTLTYDAMYEQLKTLNKQELSTYYKYDQEVRENYRLEELIPKDLGDTKSLLIDSFGNYYPEN